MKKKINKSEVKTIGCEARSSVLYARVRPSIKDRLSALAKIFKVSESVAADSFLDAAMLNAEKNLANARNRQKHC